MEFSLREWLIILGVLVIVGVLLDGFRRVRSGKRNSLKLSIDKNLNFRNDDRVDYFNGELPSGSARVVNRSDQEEQDESSDTERQEDEDVMLDPLFADGREVEHESFDELEQVESIETKAQPDSSEAKVQTGANPQAEMPEVEEVIVINVFAKDDNGLNGGEILRLVLACGMRFGDMDIFHRNESEAGDGAIQFSMANAVKPGVFNLEEMENFHTPGVSFFLSLPGPKESMKAFDYMLETAQCLAKNLNGDMQDELHSVMTKQTIEHSRQKIRDFERRQLSLLK